MDLLIRDRVALVTGGARGIGAAIAIKLAEEGVKVVVTSRSPDQLSSFVNANRGRYQHDFIGLQHSLKNKDLDSLFMMLRESSLAVDILVNNAGDTLGVTDPFCSQVDWDNVMELNFSVPVAISAALLPPMIANGWGRVVNITSCAGLENSGPVTFSTAKAAITAYSRSMGRVLATLSQNVVMTAVFPGVVATEGGHWDVIRREDPARAEKYLKERCPLGRFGLEDEIANTVVFYCSELASFSHGAIVPVDGGQSKHYMYQNYL